MTNNALLSAMNKAHVTESDLAKACGVDPKTVSRWVVDEARVPRPTIRWRVCEVLGQEESVLWPDAIKSSVKSGPDREVQTVYPYRSACPRTVWKKLITRATDRLVFAGYTNYFLWLEQPNLGAALRRKVQQGCTVRFLLGEPEGEVTRHREGIEQNSLSVSTRIQVTLSELARLGPDSGVEYRFSEGHLAMSVWLFDQESLVSPHVADALGHESPLLHLRKCQDNGIYDRFAHHVDWLWNHARQP